MYKITNIMYDIEFIDNVIDLMNRREIEFTLNSIKYKIPGFSSYKNIPDALLYRHIKKAFQSIKNIQIFYSNLIKSNEKNFSKETKEELIIGLDSKKDMPSFIKLVLITYYYPEMYTKNKEELIKVLKNKDKLSQKISLIDTSELLNTKVNIVTKESLNKIRKLFEVVVDEENKKSIDEVEIKDNYKKIFIRESLEILQKIYLQKNEYLQIATLETENNQLNIALLLINELLTYTEKKLSEKKETIKELQKINRMQKKELHFLNSEKEKIEERFFELEQKYEKLNESNKKKIELLNNQKIHEINKKEDEIQQLTREKEILMKEIEENIGVMQKLQLINENVNFYLFKENKAIEVIFGKDKISYVNTIEDLLNNIVKMENRTIFIETNNISTKEQFNIENKLKKNNIRYLFLSQDTSRIIRSAITYLEGEYVL